MIEFQYRLDKYKMNQYFDNFRKANFVPQNKKEAQERLDLFLEIKEDRVNEIKNIFQEVDFDYSRESLIELEAYIPQVVRKDPVIKNHFGNGFPDEKTWSLMYDIEMYTGDCIIAHTKGAKWGFFDVRKGTSGRFAIGIVQRKSQTEYGYFRFVGNLDQYCMSVAGCVPGKEAEAYHTNNPRPISRSFDQILEEDGKLSQTRN